MCHLSRRRMSCQISRPTWCVQPRRSCLATSGCWAGYVLCKKTPPPAQYQGSCSAAGGFGRERCVAGASGDAGNANSLDESAPKFKPSIGSEWLELQPNTTSLCSCMQAHWPYFGRITSHLALNPNPLPCALFLQNTPDGRGEKRGLCRFLQNFDRVSRTPVSQCRISIATFISLGAHSAQPSRRSIYCDPYTEWLNQITCQCRCHTS